MELRDYFAAHAPMPEQLALDMYTSGEDIDVFYRVATEHAYKWADAMMKARQK